MFCNIFGARLGWFNFSFGCSWRKLGRTSTQLLSYATAPLLPYATSYLPYQGLSKSMSPLSSSLSPPSPLPLPFPLPHYTVISCFLFVVFSRLCFSTRLVFSPEVSTHVNGGRLVINATLHTQRKCALDQTPPNPPTHLYSLLIYTPFPPKPPLPTPC